MLQGKVAESEAIVRGKPEKGFPSKSVRADLTNFAADIQTRRNFVLILVQIDDDLRSVGIGEFLSSIIASQKRVIDEF
jgi:hypothetical protein